MARILVVEDEKDLQEVLDYNLTPGGPQRDHRRPTAGTALAASRNSRPDLVLLDLMLPDLSGTEVCRTAQGRPGDAAFPILMLTAKGEEIDRVVGFELGADDYVVKPFSVRELLLRIDAVLRRGDAGRRRSARRARVRPAARRSRRAPRLGRRRARSTLTALEFRLLVTLLERRGRVQSRPALLDDVWGIERRRHDAHRRHARQAPAREARQRRAHTSRRCAASATASPPRPTTQARSATRNDDEP